MLDCQEDPTVDSKVGQGHFPGTDYQHSLGFLCYPGPHCCFSPLDSFVLLLPGLLLQA